MTNLSSVLPANEARANIYKLLDEVSNNLRRFVITHRGKPKAIVMPVEEVEAWEETMEIMSDKKLMKDLKKSEDDIKHGRVYTLEEVIKKYKLDED